jgi:hypothetical protein
MHQQQRHPDRNIRLAQMLDHCDKAQWRLHRKHVNVFCEINSFLKRKLTVCRTFEMTNQGQEGKKKVFWNYVHTDIILAYKHF